MQGFKVYIDEAGKFRWKLLINAGTRNEEIIATSHQGFDTHRECCDQIDLVKEVVPSSGVLPQEI